MNMLTKTLLGLTATTTLALTGAASAATIDFDTDANWTAGSGGITSYQSDHTYAESGWSFTGGPALRNGTTAQDGVAGALGTYSWRLRDQDATWTATYGAAGTIGEFGFDVRRWDGTPDPNWDVAYSTNGGTNFTSVLTVNNTYLGSSSEWKTFSFTLPTAVDVEAGEFIVQFERTGGERIMIDNFTYAVPEPSSLALLGLGGLLIARRRRTA